MKVSQKQAGAHERITEGQPESLRLVSVFAASVADAVGILQELTSFPTGGNLQPSPHVTKSSRLSLDICPTEMSAAQFSSVTQLCLTLCNPVDCSMPAFAVHHQLPELAQTQVSDAIQPSHPLPSPSPAFNLPQHQGLFQQLTSIQASQDRLIHSLKEVKRKGTCSLKATEHT